MTRQERVCRVLSTWMLRVIAGSTPSRAWWEAASRELWRREAVDSAIDEDSGPWASDRPRGVN